LPLAYPTHLNSTYLLERFHEQIQQRTLVVLIFPQKASCLRLVRAIGAETHEAWMERSR
jgi:transposase-like protein